jgi:hypothetical protein
MSIKVYLHYQPASGGDKKTSKIQIPKSWVDTKTVADVIELYAKGYNSKSPEDPIVTPEFHMEDSDHNELYSDVICGTVLADHGDYNIKRGVSLKPIVAETVRDPALVRCKNYGCNQYFREEDNHAEACQHHTAPPVFHDTLKYWSCCPNRKAFDFETFQQITGCNKGHHSTVNAGVSISASPNATAGGEFAPVSVPLKSIDSYNAENPTAASSEQTAARAAAAATVRTSTRSADGQTAKCLRMGCNKPFNVADNHPRACRFHCGAPIFHDAAKFWSCCPGWKKYDFDAFLAVEGCRFGYHDDGVIDADLVAQNSQA